MGIVNTTTGRVIVRRVPHLILEDAPANSKEARNTTTGRVIVKTTPRLLIEEVPKQK